MNNRPDKFSKSMMNIPPSGIRKFFEMLIGHDDVISLSVGEPDFPTPWVMREEAFYHLEKGHKVLPMCDEDECPDFDYFGGGCPGHDVKYYDDDDKEITKEEYEQKGGEWHDGYTQAELFNLKKI